MRYAIVSNGVIDNIIECASDYSAVQLGALPVAENAQVGDLYAPCVSTAKKLLKIEQSKADLKTYLATHPLLWLDGNYYSITEEKQRQLTSKLAVAQAKATLNIPYELKWNTTDDVCVPWELADLYALAFAIDERVTALVAYQQQQEVNIRNATTQEELDKIIINYDEV